MAPGKILEEFDFIKPFELLKGNGTYDDYVELMRLFDNNEIPFDEVKFRDAVTGKVIK